MPTEPLSTKPIRYRNVPYAFEITFPRWWQSYTVVDRVTCPEETETTVSFRFRYREAVFNPVISLIIEPLPEELPNQFLKSDKLDYDYRRFGRQIRLLKAIFAQAPLVIQSFRFITPDHS